MFFAWFSLSPTNSGYLSSVLSLYLPSEMIVNITGDENGSIPIFPVFWVFAFFAIFGRFWPFLGIFGVLLEIGGYWEC